MVLSKSMPISSQKPSCACSPDIGLATPISTPSKYAQHCHSESNSAPSHHHKAVATASYTSGKWDMHCLNASHCQAALPPPCSPPESENSLSAFSTFGSASSSSSSFFNDTCSYNGVLGELSPSSVGTKEAMVSPVRLSFQDMQLGSKLHSFGYSTSVHTMPRKSESKGGCLHDGFLEFSFEKGRVIDRHALVNGYPDCKSTCMGSIHQHCDLGEYEGKGRQQRASFVGKNNPITQDPFVSPKTSRFSSIGHDTHCMVAMAQNVSSKEPTLATCPSEACDAKHRCGDKTIFYSDSPCIHEFKELNGSEYRTEHGSTSSKNGINERKMDNVTMHLRENDCMLTHSDGLLEQPSMPEGGLSKTSDKYGRHPGTYVGSCTDWYRDTQKYLKCVLECGSSPYDTEIGIDIASLKHLPDLMTPCKEVSLSRALSLHQSPYTYGRPPLIPTPKLNNTPCSPGGSSKDVLQRRSFTGFSSDSSGSPAWHSKRRQIQNGAGASSLNTKVTSSTVYSNEDTAKIADELCVGPGRISYTHNSYIEHSSLPSFLPTVKKNAEKSSAHIHSEARRGCEFKESPTTFSSKAHRDWRSRSLGERASLKSTARNLEAAFAGYKSASLHKSSSCISKGVPKNAAQLDDLKSMDIVSVGSIDGHKDHPCRLDSSDRSLDRKCHFSEDMVPCSAPLSRKATPSSIEMHVIACAPKNLVIKPLAPIAHKRRRPKFELLCKPLLPVAQSIYQLPSSKSALCSEKPCSSGYSLQWLSSNTSKVTSPLMLEAVVQCTSTDGLSCYTMTLEGAEEMLMAKDCRPETPSSTVGPKWLCTFYSGKVAGKGPRGWRRWTRRENKAALDIIGIMQVSSVYKSDTLLVAPERDYSLALEFVLYDGKAHTATHSQSLRICPKDMPSHKRSVLGFPTEGMWSSSRCTIPSRLSHQGNVETELTSLSIVGGSSLVNGSVVVQATTPMKSQTRHRPTYSLDGWSDSDFTDSDSHVHDPSLLSHMELAAIVIRLPMKSHQSMLNVMDDFDNMGGWGLKFLNGGTEADKGRRVPRRVSLNVVKLETMEESSTSMESAHFPYKEHEPLLDSSSSYGCSLEAESRKVTESQKTGDLDMEVNVGAVKQDTHHHEKTGLSECLTLILPLGDHSLPSAGVKRPSSLIERWESGGSCECGGWDVGCGIEVLRPGKPGATSHTSTTPALSHDQPISLFSQGSRKELMFSLSPVKQGQYKLKFQEKLSHLRAFATAVAILHGRETASISLLTSTSTSSTSPSTSTSTSASTSTSTLTTMLSSSLSS